MAMNHIVIDDFIEPAYFAAMKEEIRTLEPEMKLDDWNPDYTKMRAHLDDLYANRRLSKILHFVELALFNDIIYRKAEQIQDYCMQIMRYCTIHFTYLTGHIPGKPCSWHNDIGVSGNLFLLNFILYVDMGGKFAGGNLVLSDDAISVKSGSLNPEKEPTKSHFIVPKDNRLVIIPSHLWHMVETIHTTTTYNSPLDGRITINGHIGFRLA